MNPKRRRLLVALIPWLVVLATVAVFAQSNNTSTASYTFTLPVSLAAVAAALPYTLAYAVGNYVDSRLNQGEAFNGRMFVKTLVISVAMAVLIAYIGLDPRTSTAYAFLFIVGNKVLMQDVDNAINKAWSLAGEIKIERVPSSLSVTSGVVGPKGPASPS